jgi:hypothetical protein
MSRRSLVRIASTGIMSWPVRASWADLRTVHPRPRHELAAAAETEPLIVAPAGAV